MSARPWMPLYIADYLADTAHLNAAEHGAYLLLIMHYWRTGGLPENEAQIARIARMTHRQWSQSSDLLKSFFDDHWRHARIDKELAQAIEISQRRSASAKEMHARRKVSAGNEQVQMHTQSHSQSHKKDLRAVATATRSPGRFEEFWKAYPKRDGANPKKPALKVFAQSVKSGHDPGAIIAGAERYRDFMLAKGQEGTQYVAQAVTWLRQARWEDELPSAINGAGATDDDYPRIKRMLDTEAERGEWPFVNTPKATIAPEHIARWQAERAAL